MKSATFFTAQMLTSLSPTKSFLIELYRIVTNNSLINSRAYRQLNGYYQFWILSRKLMKEMSETGKFLHFILELAEKLLREADT